MTLNDLMEFDHVVISDGLGGFTDAPKDVWAPAPYVDLGDDGQMLSNDIHDLGDWSLLTGFSSQDRYSGPIMHPSEYVGGGMETYIREHAGRYVCVVVAGIGGPEDDDDVVGWAVAYQSEED